MKKWLANWENVNRKTIEETHWINSFKILISLLSFLNYGLSHFSSSKSKTLDILEFIDLVFQNLEGRCNPFSTGAFLAWKDYLSKFALAFGTVEFYLIFHIIYIEPLWLFNKNWCTVSTRMLNLWKQKMTALFASVSRFCLNLCCWGFDLWLHFTLWSECFVIVCWWF